MISMNEALRPVRGWIQEVIHLDSASWSRDKYTSSEALRLRLDFELHDGGMDRLHHINPIMDWMASDLSYLMEHGDTDSNYPLLKVLDGSKKTGKKLKSLDFDAMAWEAKSVWRKDTVEYTLWLSVIPEWENV